MAEVMPSVVAIPEDSIPTSPSTNGLKRRQSDVSEQESKRQRTSPGKSSPTAQEEEVQTNGERDISPKATQKTEDTRETKKKVGKTDEKQRSKRLFGALLGNLNQPSDRTSKRRSEIEQRRKAELQKQDDERLEDRQRRLERLEVQRKKEQINVDEQNMHVRHKNLLNAANFLQTNAEPRLYYRPWDLLADEEDRIDEQVRDAQTQVDKELAEFEEEKRRRLNELGESNDPPTENIPPVEEPVADAQDEPAETTRREEEEDKVNGDEDKDGDKQEADDRTDSKDLPAEVPDSDLVEPVEPVEADGGKSEAVDAKEDTEEKKDDVEDDGEHVVEGDEDTVIY